MSLPTYATYKVTGIRWLGNVPAHWQLCRIRFAASLNPSKTEIADIDRSIEVSFLPMEAIGDDGSLALDRTRPIREVEVGYTYFRDGDVVLAKITPCFENGKGALIRGLQQGIGFGTTELIVARPTAGRTTSGYLNWVFRSPNFRREGEASMYGAGGQKRVPDAFVRNFTWAFPSISEQAEIADFLDRETAKIDALVAEQEKLLALLAEKRQATISHAVTRGLDPHVPMKDSGIPWLGKMPRHWRVARFRDLCEYISTGPFGTALGHNDYVEGGVPVVNPSHIVDSQIVPDYEVSVSLETAKRLSSWVLRAGDIVVARRGELGRAAIVSFENDGWICGTGSLRVTVDASRATPEFLHAILQSSFSREWLNQRSVGSTMANLNERILGELPVAAPEAVAEQLEVVSRLNEAVARIDRVIDSAKKSVDLLRERRSALISAAVTGQIDVRGLVEAQAA